MKNIFIFFLSALTLGLLGYMLYDSINEDMGKAEIKSQFHQLKSEYEDMQREFEVQLKSEEVIDAELIKYKARLDEITSKSTITEEELKEAKRLMQAISIRIQIQYRNRIRSLEAEKENFQVEKEDYAQKMIKLNTSLKQVETQKEDIHKKLVVEEKVSKQKDEIIEYASKISLSNFILKSYKVRSNGKEVETDKASRIDRVHFSFEVNESKIVPSGKKTLFIIAYTPDGKVMNFQNVSQGTFKLENGKTLTYSDKVTLDYKTGQTPTFELTWDNPDFQRGNYVIEIYQDGSRVGKTTKTLE